MKKRFIFLALLIAAFASDCSPNRRPSPPPQKKEGSPFDGTTDALKKMRIPEISTHQQFPGFRGQPKKAEEKRK